MSNKSNNNGARSSSQETDFQSLLNKLSETFMDGQNKMKVELLKKMEHSKASLISKVATLDGRMDRIESENKKSLNAVSQLDTKY